MPITININDNPVSNNNSGTTIYSGLSTTVVQYEIRRYDRQPINMKYETSILISSQGALEYNDVNSVTATALDINIPNRQKYQVRVRGSSSLGGLQSAAWSDWTKFKTRDKKYGSPDAITSISDDSTEQIPLHGRHGKTTYIVTNNGKATVTRTNHGATVINSDTGYVGTSSISYTARGATIINS